MLRRIFLFLSILCVAITSAIAEDTRTQIFDPSFRTLKVSSLYDFYAAPVVRLPDEGRVVISFDQIGDDVSYLQYRLVHCNADWQPSRLFESEYLDGFNIAPVDDYAYSQNTYIHYVNYRIELPNADMTPLVSGNYLVQVFYENEPENVVLQARFSVEEPLAIVRGGASARTDRGINEKWQQLEFEVDPGQLNIRDPYNEIIVTVEQNGRTDNVRTLAHPSSVRGKLLVYEHLNDLIYPAGNEFRRFETVRAQQPGMHVDSIRFGGTNFHAWLMPDQPRKYSPYLYDETQYGRFLVREYNSTDSDLGADYFTVNFRLDIPEIPGSDVYVAGELAQNIFSRHNRMSWNSQQRCYELTMPLKQGSYNYEYIVVPKGTELSEGDASRIDGDKYETSNEFIIKVFYRPFGARGDRLISTARIYSSR